MNILNIHTHPKYSHSGLNLETSIQRNIPTGPKYSHSGLNSKYLFLISKISKTRSLRAWTVDKPTRFMIRLLFGFASDSLFVKLKKISTNSETAMLSIRGPLGPTSCWRPFRPLNFVLCALWALRQWGPHGVPWASQSAGFLQRWMSALLDVCHTGCVCADFP